MHTKRLLSLAALLPSLLAGGTSLGAAIDHTAPTVLAFGRAVTSGVPGTVVVSPTGSRTSTGGVTLLGGAASAASLTVTGDPDRAFSITLSGSTTLSAGSGSMTVDTFVVSPESSAWNLGPGGSQVVYVGATLHVGASQAAAGYQGTYAITVAYQ
jgi:hypothetical protein